MSTPGLLSPSPYDLPPNFLCLRVPALGLRTTYWTEFPCILEI